MAIKQLSELDDYKLTNSEQDCRGWSVVNAAGTQIGTVREMLVDKERERVTAVVLDSGVEIPVNEISLHDGRVVAAKSYMAGASGRTQARRDDADMARLTARSGQVVDLKAALGQRQDMADGVSMRACRQADLHRKASLPECPAIRRRWELALPATT